MTPAPTTVHPATDLADALALLTRLDLDSLPVTDSDGWLCGFVTVPDLVTADDEQFMLRTVGDVYRRSTIAARVDDDLASALRTMAATAASNIPVVDHQGRVVGVLGRCDLARATGRVDHVIAHEIDRVLSWLGRDEWQVSVTEGVAAISGPSTDAERSFARTVVSTVDGVVSIRVA